MKAIVVYESLWGNTAAVARAIAEGLGSGARVLSTAEATAAELAGADLIVAGAPVMGFSLPNDSSLRNVAMSSHRGAPAPPDLSHPAMRTWLGTVPPGQGRSTAFETRLRGPWPGGATKAIVKGLERAGYPSLAKPASFYVLGQYGPLAEGELERARQWGVELAKA